MSALLIIAVLMTVALFAATLKVLIDVNALVIFLRKSKALRSLPNPLDRQYQLIKGLY